MFKDTFIKLCNKKGVPPTVACHAIGLSSAAFSKWDETSVPRRATLQKFADYFGVTVDYLLGSPDYTEPSSPISDIKKELLTLLDQADEEKLKQISDYVEFIMKK